MQIYISTLFPFHTSCCDQQSVQHNSRSSHFCAVVMLIFALWTCFLIKPHTSAAQVQVNECEYLHCSDRVKNVSKVLGTDFAFTCEISQHQQCSVLSLKQQNTTLAYRHMCVCVDTYIYSSPLTCQWKRACIWRKFWMEIFTESMFSECPIYLNHGIYLF